jgi:hypothetical protein
MKELAAKLRSEFAGYRHVRVMLFDDPRIAGEYLRGIRAPKDIDKDIRGVYERNQDTLSEFIEFSPEKGGKFNEIRISLAKNANFSTRCGYRPPWGDPGGTASGARSAA